jgi:alkanesulfonate monooxygenase SsuD/methylene tetrahydromethanopterin reductase-like flavin-dependent oxidoreductase (luciferase family)
MKLGFFIQPVHPPSRPYGDVLREDREAVVLADRLGYREAFIGEHLVDAAEPITSSLAFIASLADACPSITFGTGVLPLANYHPAMAAAQVAMVDQLVQGRLVLGVGPGVRGDAEAIGDLGSDRNRKTQEALDHMCRIWREAPPYRIEGEFYRTTTERSLDPDIGVGVARRPLQQPHPPIAITSIRPDRKGPHAAGARGWSGISATYVGAYVVRAQIRNYLEGRRAWLLLPCHEDQARPRRRAGRDARLSRPARSRALDRALPRAPGDRGNPAERRGPDSRVPARRRRVRHAAVYRP